jgi:hypothetical protein
MYSFKFILVVLAKSINGTICISEYDNFINSRMVPLTGKLFFVLIITDDVGGW